MTLLPCPFCGGSVDLVQHHSPSFRVICLWCDSCGGRGASGDEAAEKWNRRASYATHFPAVMAATEPVQLHRPLPMAEAVEERSCFTCANDWSAGRPPFHYCNCTADGVRDYMTESGAETSTDGLPTDRTLKCPGWVPKEPT